MYTTGLPTGKVFFVGRVVAGQSNNLLSLDEAASTLGVKRRELASFASALDIKYHRGDDRRSYLSPQDVDRIASFRESKANPAYSGMTILSDMPVPHTMERNTRAYVKEGYGANDTIYKVVNYCITNGAAIPPRLYTNRTMQETIDSHPLLDKLDSPNPEWDGVFYREGILGWYLVTGNSFQYSIRKGTTGPPDELWTLEAQKVHPIPSRKLGITGYRYDDFEEDQNIIPALNIAHMRSWNPLDPIFGLSPLAVGGIMVDMQTASRKWDLALLQNYAKPPGAWVFDGILDVNTRKKVKEALNNEMAGYRNAGKVPVLDGGFKWVSSMTPPSELDWLESLKYNAGQLANLYNIAPQLIGDTSASTYHNMEEAKAASYTEAIFPMLDKMYSYWNRWLLPMYPDLKNAYLYYDKTTVEVVQAVIQQRLTAAVDRANKSWMQGSCTLNEAREQQGLAPIPGGDVFRFGAVLVRSSELDKYAEQSLQKPAAPPAPVPENILDTTPPTQGNEPTNNNNQQEEQPPKKPASKPEQNKEEEQGKKQLKRYDDATSAEHTGVMVAFMLDDETAKQLALPDGEPADSLHVTLAFLGDKSEFDDGDDTLKDTLATYASEAIPLEGSVSGLARFTPSDADDGLSPVVALVNVPGLAKWRERLVKQLEAEGYEVASNFEYLPHVTLKYINADDPMPTEDVPDVTLKLDTLTLAIGDEHSSFPIGKEEKHIHIPLATKADEKPQWQVELEQTREDQLNELFDAQVTHVRWVVDGKPCELCLAVEGEVIELGDTFSNGVECPPLHVNCQCTLQEYTIGERGKRRHVKPAELEARRGKRQAREDYRKFMEAHLA